MEAPDTIEKCGNVPCPQWITTEWTPCRTSKCFAWHTALQKRNVSCSTDNETVSEKCDENEKPTTKQECYNEHCKGVWRVDPWSEVRIIHENIRSYMSLVPPPVCIARVLNINVEIFTFLCLSRSPLFLSRTSVLQCNAPCGGKGTRYRTLQCVWYGTRKPAGNACNNQPRPAVIKPCNGAPCVVDRK